MEGRYWSCIIEPVKFGEKRHGIANHIIKSSVNYGIFKNVN